VLIDNSHLSPQWRRLIGEFLSPRLGGSAEAWGVANIPAFEAQVERWRVAMAGGGPADFRGFFAKDARRWFLVASAEAHDELVAGADRRA
jgi:hypothetical protein